MIRRILLAVSLLLVATQADAAKCYIKEYSGLGAGNTSGSIPQIAAEPSIVDQTPIDFTSGIATSQPFNPNTKFIRIFCDAQASYQINASPTALNTMSPLSAGGPEYFGVTPGHKLSVVANP